MCINIIYSTIVYKLVFYIYIYIFFYIHSHLPLISYKLQELFYLTIDLFNYTDYS